MKKIFGLFGFILTLPALLTALEIVPVAPQDGATVPLLSPAQKAFVTMPREPRIKFFADAEKRKELKAAGYYPLPVKFAWKSDASDKAEFRVLVSRNADLADARTVPGQAGAAQIDNLEIGRTYYWQVEAAGPGRKPVRSALREFSTEDQPPRLLRIPEVPNVRDLGGRKTRNGMYVKQNRIFRTAGMNSNARMVAPKDDAELFAAFPEAKGILRLWKTWRKRHKDHPGELKIVKYALGNQWTVFIADRDKLGGAELKELDTLALIPKTFMGVKPEIMTANPRGRVMLPFERGKAKVAVLMQVFDAPADGMMQIATGGDWYWNVRVNGQLVFSRIQGNGKSATTSNYHYFVPVKKGKNLFAVVLKNGDKNWMWCCGKRKKQDFMKNLDENIAALRKTPLKMVAGANRVAPEGRYFFLDLWKVKSDIDLRSDRECWGMTGSPLGPGVKWHHISSSAYAGMQTEGGKAQFAKVFKVFLDEKNYPVIFHCIAGQDRTGAVAFILNGLLGVDEEELYRDWEATGFWNKNVKFNHELRFNRLIDGFRKLPGKTLHEQIENYVLSCGFTKADIERFRALMLEKAPKSNP